LGEEPPIFPESDDSLWSTDEDDSKPANDPESALSIDFGESQDNAATEERSEQEAPVGAADPPSEDPIPFDGEWTAEVADYLERLARHLTKRGKSLHTISVPMGRARLLVTPFEQDLAFGVGEGAEVESRLHALVRDGLGIRVKTINDFRTFSKAQSGVEKVKIKKLIKRDAELGQMVAYEMHLEIKKLAKNGEIEDAQHFSEYRRSVLYIAEHAADVVGGDSDQLVLPEGLLGIRNLSGTQQEYDEDAAAAAREAATAKIEKKGVTSRLVKRIQIVTLAVLFATLISVLYYLWSMRPRELDHFQKHDFPEVPGLVQVIHREPHLIVIVEPRVWGKTVKAERLTAVQGVVDSVISAGYRSVEFRSMNQGKLALWKKGGKIALP